ncbi:unnamed protein product [Amoebophrya sp. A25]|nr:unnamed protein product [Amoebophrya sp. A25]|eukprot:GSA25T00020236001.1
MTDPSGGETMVTDESPLHLFPEPLRKNSGPSFARPEQAEDTFEGTAASVLFENVCVCTPDADVGSKSQGSSRTLQKLEVSIHGQRYIPSGPAVTTAPAEGPAKPNAYLRAVFAGGNGGASNGGASPNHSPPNPSSMTSNKLSPAATNLVLVSAAGSNGQPRSTVSDPKRRTTRKGGKVANRGRGEGGSSTLAMATLIAESKDKILLKCDVQHCLRELGICKRHNRFLWAEVGPLLDKFPGPAIHFLNFLALFQRLKELGKRLLMDIFESYAPLGDFHAEAGNHVVYALFPASTVKVPTFLSMGEVSRLLTDIGLAPRTKAEQDQLRAILNDSDVDSSGEIDFHEFQGLYARVILEYEFTQGEQMLREARELGFLDEEHVLELKEIFDIIDTDHSGKLDITEVREVIGKLYHIAAPQSFLTSETLWGLFHSLELDPLRDGIDFHAFLRMIRNIESGHHAFAHLKAIFGFNGEEDEQLEAEEETVEEEDAANEEE